ncbi:hypothetical protein KCP69_19605 [Salmonella enterica subsp. enterica]|nr:hypothetical protein KCP69_19605 [Salmonella enterica subsp. enterica]
MQENGKTALSARSVDNAKFRENCRRLPWCYRVRGYRGRSGAAIWRENALTCWVAGTTGSCSRSYTAMIPLHALAKRSPEDAFALSAIDLKCW